MRVCAQDGWTPLHIAAFKGYASCVKVLVGKANVDLGDKVGEGLQGVASPRPPQVEGCVSDPSFPSL